MEIIDPVTGNLVSISDDAATTNSEVAASEAELEKAEVLEVAEELKEDPKKALYKELEEVQDGRPISEIPLSDSYWDVKKKFDLL